MERFELLTKTACFDRGQAVVAVMATFAAIIDGVVTRALTTNDPTADILRSAQNKIELKGLKFQ